MICLSRWDRRFVTQPHPSAACARLNAIAPRSESCAAGELAPARELYAELLPLARLDMTPKLVQYFKAAMDEVGFAGGPTRAPRLPLTEAEREDLAAALDVLRAGVPA